MSINYEQIGKTTQIDKRNFSVHGLPEGVVLRDHLGLVTSEHLDGHLLHRARATEGGLFECRGTISPNGDFLLILSLGRVKVFSNRKPEVP